MRLTLLAAALIAPLVCAAQQSTSSPTQQTTSGPTFDSLAAAAAAAREQNDLPRAAALYQQAVAADPQWPDGWWYLGVLGYSANDYVSAEDALNHYLELMPKAGPAFALRGLCEFESSDYDRSLKDIEQAVALGAANDARNAQILQFHEALLLTRAARFEEALAVYQKLAAAAPPNPELLTGIGMAGLREAALPSETPAGAQELAESAGQAAWEFMTGDHAGAAEAFAGFFTRYPTASNAHYFYAWLLFVHEPDAARDQLEQELKLDANHVPALTLMAWSNILNGNNAAALPLARRAESLEPGLFMSQLVLGRALTGTGEVREGIDHLQQAERLDPNNVEAHIGLAIAYSKAGERDLEHRERMQSLAMTEPQSVYGQR